MKWPWPSAKEHERREIAAYRNGWKAAVIALGMGIAEERRRRVAAAQVRFESDGTRVDGEILPMSMTLAEIEAGLEKLTRACPR